MTTNTFNKIRKNVSAGFIVQIVSMVVGIVVPRLFIVSFGSEVNGYISSINQLFVYVALLEAGVGGASLQALYKPVGQSDRKKINSIIAATNYFYKRTGVLYLLAVGVIAFVYPLLVPSSLEYSFMVVVTVLTGAGGAIPYFVHAKYKILFQAEGKNYFISNVSILNQVMLSLGKVFLLLQGFNVFAVQSLYLVLSFVQAVVYEVYVRRNYPWLDLHATPDNEAISQKNSVLVHQISGLIFNNTDTLLITFFLGLNAASVYSLYKTFVSFIGSMISNFSDGISFRLGQIFDDRERFVRYHDIYETFHVALTFCLYGVTLVFFSPFLELYTAGMDINYIVAYMPLCAVCMEVLNYARTPSGNVITFAGHFRQTQWRSVLESAINLIATIIFINAFGLCGALMGTIVALLYRTNDIIIYVNRRILNRSCWLVYKLWLVNLAFTTGYVVLLTQVVALPTGNYVVLFLSAIVVGVIVLPLQLGLSFLSRRDVCRNLVSLIKKRRSAR